MARKYQLELHEISFKVDTEVEDAEELLIWVSRAEEGREGEVQMGIRSRRGVSEDERPSAREYSQSRPRYSGSISACENDTRLGWGL